MMTQNPQPVAENRHGFAVLASPALAVEQALEETILGWATQAGAEEWRYPPLMRVADLEKFDYFVNFPHLGICACPLNDISVRRFASNARADDEPATGQIVAADLADAGFVLPPAACFNVYLSIEGASLAAPYRVTTVARCFRNEDHVKGLQRLRGFTMREIVHVGPPDTVKEFLEVMKARVVDFATAVDLPLSLEQASDPFFDPNSARAKMAQLFPTKTELVYRGHDGDVAIASLNYHRNFFGERCRITADGESAHTGCVAFGLERWLHALMDRYSDDAESIVAAIREGASR